MLHKEENLDSTNEELEVDPTENQSDKVEESEDEELEEDATEEYSEREKQLFARLKKAEAKKKELKAQLMEAAKSQPKEESKKPTKKPAKEDWKVEYEKLALKQDFPDLTHEEIEKARKYAEVEGKTAEEVIKSPYFQAQVTERKEQEKQRMGTPSPSGRTTGGGSSNQLFDRAMENPSLIKEMDEKTYKKFVEYSEKRT